MNDPRRPSRSGFTLLELTVVLFILGLLAALMAPAFKGFFQSSKLLEATSGLRNTIRYVQQRAATEGMVQVLELNFETGAYFVEKRDEDSIRHRWRRSRSKEFEIRRILPEHFSFHSVYFPELEEKIERDEARLEFYPDGTTRDAEVVLKLEDEDNKVEKYYMLVVQGTTGHVSKPMPVSPSKL
jgi:prepilin-type N-terminal cleavage/methylation domain-containing protein